MTGFGLLYDLSVVVGVALAILYCVGIGLLLRHNANRNSAWAIAALAAVCWPPLAFMSFMQLVFVVPLYTAFLTNGFDISKPLSKRTVVLVFGLTLLFSAVVSVAAIIHDS